MKKLSVKEVCEELCIQESTLAKWRSKGQINYYKIGKKTFYDKQHIEDLKNEKTVYCNKRTQMQDIISKSRLS